MDLDGPRASLLSILVFAGPRTMGQLAELERVTPAAITKLVTALEVAGLVERRRDGTDRRVTTVHATPAGQDILRRGREARVRLVADLLDGLSPPDLAVLRRAAELIEERLHAHPAAPPGRQPGSATP